MQETQGTSPTFDVFLLTLCIGACGIPLAPTEYLLGYLIFQSHYFPELSQCQVLNFFQGVSEIGKAVKVFKKPLIVS